MPLAFFEVTSHYITTRTGLLTEVRFHVQAANENGARSKSRVLMRERYPGEIDDATYIEGVVWVVPGVTLEGRLFPPVSPSKKRWRLGA